jgi:MFS family permease
MAPFSLAGTFVAGLLADRIAGRYLLAVAQGCLVAAMLWSVTIVVSWQAFAYGAVLGFTSGFAGTLQSVIWPNYFGRRHVGSIRSAAATGMMASAAIGPFPFGWTVDFTGSYRMTVLLFVALPVMSAVAALVAKPPRT